MIFQSGLRLWRATVMGYRYCKASNNVPKILNGENQWNLKGQQLKFQILGLYYFWGTCQITMKTKNRRKGYRSTVSRNEWLKKEEKIKKTNLNPASNFLICPTIRLSASWLKVHFLYSYTILLIEYEV